MLHDETGCSTLRRRCIAWLIGILMAAGSAHAGTLTIDVRSEEGDPLPCRIHLFDAAGQPQRAGVLPYFRDHFVCPGHVSVKLSPGKYRFEIERGHEYRRATGSVEMAGAEKKSVTVTLKRIANLAADGWYSGDLHVHRSIEDMKLLMRADDLHVAPVITWWNDRTTWIDRSLPKNPLVRFDGNRYFQAMAGEDEREGGALMYFGRKTPLPITGSSREYPSPMKFVLEARRADEPCWIDIEKPFWWDVPVWLAMGRMDSIGLANNHMCRSKMLESEAWGRPRDVDRLPAPRGNGYWTQEIYYHMLNCGLRIPPSAGSASGVLPNPVGYNRVYVHVGGEFSHAAWWKGLKAGRSFVTNGPLLLCRANGRLPGHVFSGKEGDRLKIDITAKLITQDDVPAIEIIRDGRVERSISPEELAQSSTFRAGGLGSIVFDRSGWFLVRAITGNRETFRFASTAPYYVEIGEKRYVDPRSARFFLDWVNERIARVERNLSDADQRREVLRYHHQAKHFWEARSAN